MNNTAFITVDADIPDKTMPAVNNAFIAACQVNPVNPVILSKMDIAVNRRNLFIIDDKSLIVFYLTLGCYS